MPVVSIFMAFVTAIIEIIYKSARCFIYTGHSFGECNGGRLPLGGALILNYDAWKLLLHVNWIIQKESS